MWGSLTFTEKLSPPSESSDPEPLARFLEASVTLTPETRVHSATPHPALPRRSFPAGSRTAAPRLLCPLGPRCISGLPALLRGPWWRLSRPGPVCGGCPSGWAWSGVLRTGQAAGLGRELLLGAGEELSSSLNPRLASGSGLSWGSQRVGDSTGCVLGPSCLHRHGPGVCSRRSLTSESYST